MVRIRNADLVNALKCVSPNALAAQVTFHLIIFHAFEALLTEPVAQTFVGEVPDMFVFAEVMRAEDVSAVTENRNRHKYEFTGYG
jgi:hypothetical protein